MGVLVLRGEGDAWSAGMDLQEYFREPEREGFEAIRRSQRESYGWFARLRDFVFIAWLSAYLLICLCEFQPFEFLRLEHGYKFIRPTKPKLATACVLLIYVRYI